MRILGIDPGTGSFDFFAMEESRILMDSTLPVVEVMHDPQVLLATIERVFPLDLIVGPSGYGLPLLKIEDMTESELDLMVPDDREIPLYQTMRKAMLLMRERGYPVCFTPGVIHLKTVPSYRKANKLDMGTADKVCCAALAIKDQAELYNIEYDQTSFLLVEIGYAFTAVIAVEDGKIVDGLGGTSGGPGFIAMGGMDAEVASRLGKISNRVIFSGGARDLSGKTELTPEELAHNKEKYAASWQMLIESVVKGVAALAAIMQRPREILLSGRLSRIPEIEKALQSALSRFGKVRKVRRQAKVAKEAAEGAFILGEGLLGGKYKALVDALRLREAEGSIFDYFPFGRP